MKAVAKARRDQAGVLAASPFDPAAAAKVIKEFEATRATATEAADQLMLMQADYVELCWPELEYRLDLVTRFDGQRVGLMLGQDVFASDKLKVELADGGLTKISLSSDDQSVAAARDLVKTLATAPISLDFSALNMPLAPKVAIPPAMKANFFMARGVPQFLGIEELSPTGAIVPDGPPREEFLRWKPVDVPMPPLNKGPFPATLKREIRLSTVAANKPLVITETMRVAINDGIQEITFGFSVSVDCGLAPAAQANSGAAGGKTPTETRPGVPGSPPTGTGGTRLPSEDARPKSPANGVWLSSRKTCDFTILDKRFAESVRETLSAPVFDDQRLEFAPVLRTRFTTRGTTYQFANGMLASSEIDSPSPAAALAKGALEVVTAPITAVSTAIQGQQGMLEAETKRIEAQTALIDAQRKLSAAVKGETEEEEE
ncbi:MAG: hypothetical protein K9G59_15455 [Caulobacter sp.]|nr:hypothetical protein [Caulobacter sp.]